MIRCPPSGNYELISRTTPVSRADRGGLDTFTSPNSTDLMTPPMVGALGPSPLDEAFTLEIFRTLVRSRHGCVKAFLLDQRNISGIENAYSHDVLFAAGIHPQRQLSSLADSEVAALYSSILSVLKASVDLGGASYELDFYGHPGGFTEDKLLVGYAAALSRRSKPVAPIHLSVHHASPYRHGISDHHDPTQI